MVIKLLIHRIVIILVLCTSAYSFAQHCNSTGDAGVVTGMTSVQFNTINNTSATNLAYTDYTASQSTSVMQGGNYSLSVNLNTAGNWTIHSLVWIDWNQNNLFDDGAYDLGTATNETDGTTTLSGLTVAVPMGAALGTTRMRVSSKWNVDPTSCELGMDGEVEDYAVVVTAHVPSPEINVQGNGLTIINGDATPSTTDNTDFGLTTTGTPVSKTFTIQNTGSLDLSISDISLSNSTDFSITGTPYSSPVAASSSTSFEITYNAVSGNTQSSTVTIQSNDSDESNYEFSITGETSCSIISLSGSTSTNETCGGCNDRSITVGTPTGGSAPYEYSIDGVNWFSSNSFTGLSKAYFTVYARDAYGCIGLERLSNDISFSAGACVIDMGITPQTVNNGLAPYGLIYDLVQNDDVPVYWIIDPDKSFVNASTIVNQTDLTVTGTTTRLGATAITADLKSGPFLIPAEYIDDAYATIEAWQSSKPGLTVHWNLDSIPSAPVNGIITTLANVVIYPEGGNINATTDIEDAFFVPAGIPTSAYRRGFISDLNGCDEIYVLSHHTDPDANWSQQDIDDIYDYVIEGGNVWMGCHDVSISESLLTTSDGTQLNFLSENGLIPYDDVKDISTDYPYLSAFAIGDEIDKHDNNINNNDVRYDLSSAGNSIMQFMNNNHRAMEGNSEMIYLPFTGGWRSTTTAAIYDAGHVDLPPDNNRSPGEAAIVAYGPAFGNNLYGTVVYQGSHINDKNNGTTAEYVGERRIFANYLLESAIKYTKDAGQDQSFTYTSCGIARTNLEAALPVGEIGTWSIVSGSGGSFEDVNDPNSEFYGLENETYELKWSISCVEDTVNISFETDCPTLDFDGANDHISFDDHYELTSDFSFEIWILPEVQNTAVQTIFSRRNKKNLDSGYDLRLVDNTISFNWNSSGTIASPYPIGTDRWYHIAVTHTGGTYKLFIDGIEVNSVSGFAPSAVSDNVDTILGAMDNNIGYKHIPEDYFMGSLDEVRIWNVALTEDQIRSMMNQEIKELGYGFVQGAIAKVQIDGLSWGNLEGYYQMNQDSDIVKGNIMPISGSIEGRLKNSRTYQEETAPLPYTTVRDGSWSDTTVTTPWAYCNSVWNTPNSLGVDGSTKIDWNIVVINKHKVEANQSIKLFALVSLSDAEIDDEEITDSQLNIGTNGGSYGLNISRYLKLEGKIDLQNESQLIQGEGSILDEDSTGYLERDQQGTQNSYTYNYWSLPVSKRSSESSNVAATLTDVLRDGTDASSPSAINFAYHWTHADGGLTNPRKIATYWIYKFVNSGNDYNNWQWVGNTGDINASEGFTMKGTSGASAISTEQNYTFRGKPNNVPEGSSEIVHTTFPGSFDKNGNPFLSLAGNPFPSALDADQFIMDNTSGGTDAITGTLYFWEHWSNNTHYLEAYRGGYATYTLAGGTAAVSHPDVDQEGTGSKIPGQYIPVGQGFFVYQNYDDDGFGNFTNPSSGEVVFKNSHRVFQIEDGNSESVFSRPNDKNGTNSFDQDMSPIDINDNEEETILYKQKKRIWIGFESANGLHRQLLAAFLKGATDGIDKGYDGRIIDKLNTDAYFSQEHKDFSIIAFGKFDLDREIPITIVVQEKFANTTQSLMIDRIENIEEHIEVLIRDNETGETVNLREGKFEFELPAGEHFTKYTLVFRSNVSSNENDGLEIDHNEDEELDLDEELYVNEVEEELSYGYRGETLVFMNNSAAAIGIKKSNAVELSRVSLYNSIGQQVQVWTRNLEGEQLSLPASNIGTGVYIVNLESNQGLISKKLIIR